MIKLLALDLDETLLSNDKHVSKENIAALKKARENGIHTVIATGRPWFSFHETLEEIGTRHLKDEYSISLNGGAIVENEKWKNHRIRWSGLPNNEYVVSTCIV